MFVVFSNSFKFDYRLVIRPTLGQILCFFQQGLLRKTPLGLRLIRISKTTIDTVAMGKSLVGIAHFQYWCVDYN